MFASGKSPHVKRSGKRRKLLWIPAGLLLAAAAALAAAVIYLARHPAAVKPLIEKTLSAQAGAAVSIEHLTLGTDPLRLDARGISVSPGADTAGFQFDARKLSVRATLAGPFGGRTLSIDALKLEDYSGRFTPLVSLPSGSSGQPPSLTARLLKPLLRFLLFSDIRVQQVEALNGNLVFETATRQAALSIAAVRSDPQGGGRIEASARVERTDGRRLLDLPELRAQISPPGLASPGRLAGRIRLRDGHLDADRLAATALSGTADIHYDPQQKVVAVEKLQLQTRMAAEPGSKDADLESFAVSLSADATYQLRNSQLDVSRWSLHCEDLLELDGSARMQTAPPYPFRMKLAAGRLDSAELMRQLPLPAENQRFSLSISGPVRIGGDAEGRLGESPDRWKGSLQATVDQMPLAVQTETYRIEGRAGGKLQLSGSPLDPLLEAELTVGDATAAGSPVELDPFEASVDVAGRYPKFRVDLRIRTAGVQLQTAKTTYRLRQVSVSAEDGRFDAQSGEMAFPAVAISSDTLRNLAVEIDRSSQDLRAVLTGTDTGLATAAADWGLIPAGWQVEGSDRIDATLIVDEQKQLLVTSRAKLSALSAASPDQRILVEGLQAAADVNLRYRPEERKWSSVAQVSVDSGEALLGRYYHDFISHPLTMSGRATRAAPAQQFALDGIRLQLAGLIGLQIYGTMSMAASGPNVTANVRIPQTDLAALFRQFVREPYKFEHPSLEKLTLGGRVGGELQIANATGSWSARGRLAWSEGLFSLGEGGVSATGIELDLPVWHRQGTADGPSLPGSLRIDALRLPPLPQQPLQLALRAGPDSLTTTAPVDIDFGGGAVQLGTARLTSLYSGRPHLATSLSVEALPVDPFLEKIGGICRGGQLNGSLERVELADNTLAGIGTLTAEVCGGRVEIFDPGVRRLFSSSPAIGFDGVLETIDLEQLTADTSFGRIQGVLNGWVRDLEIVNGQPQAFDLLLKTERTDGVPQKINVQAVENIARLGGGASPFMGLAGTLVNLFKEFSYSKIGVRASLQNDVFRINGTIQEDGKEYLVKKGGLSGVDVVNLNPDNRISFKDMIKRIQRIQTSKGGPVVN